MWKLMCLPTSARPERAISAEKKKKKMRKKGG